jgi:hypothetical protein
MAKQLFQKGNQWQIRKGQHLSLQTEIKKGQHLSSNTEIKKGQRFSPTTEFKKGHKLSEKCLYRLRTDRGHHWKGGRKIKPSGYVMIYQPNRPSVAKSGYVPEHRLVVENYIGRYLNSKERVHHINEIKNDNRLENLYLFSFGYSHSAYHWLLNYNPELAVKITKSNLIDYQNKPVK